MKLQKQLSRKVKDKEYSKWVLTIPSSEIEKLGWSEGDEIDFNVGKKGAFLTKKIRTNSR